ncbi:MAG: prephenate dehydrogenase [Thermodesulfobacteriota bacterium]|nr:prephenate dehydrogenase [Thermodesulfobacteriota bacterium]
MRIAICGMGLIGASIARALSSSTEIVGIDRDEKTIKDALRDSVITEGGNHIHMAKGCDLVIIALPVGAIIKTARALMDCLEPGTVLTDTGSTKLRIVDTIGPMWPWYVGSHPMAGNEDSGYNASRKDLFKDAMCILTPEGHTRKQSIQMVSEIWKACGAHIVTMPPGEHDELMAVISHMPHLLSFVFMGIAENLKESKEILGKGFRDFTRVAASDPVMWRDILIENRHNLTPLIDHYIRELSMIRGYMEDKDLDALENRLKIYRQSRRDLYNSH